MKVGFIGYGSMGSMLLNGFISSGRLASAEVIVSTRTMEKLADIKAAWPGIVIAQSNAEAAQAKHVFICVKPADVRAILDEIQPVLRPDTHIVSIAGTVPLVSIGTLTGCAATKVIPTVASEVRGGVSLVCHSARVMPEDAAFIEDLLRGTGGVKLLPEADFDMATELTSCMPGFIASIFQEMVEAALRHTATISRPDAEELVLQTLLGTARLLVEKSMGFDEAIARVATKGGITEEGVKVLRAGLPQVFDEMFAMTLEKRRLVQERVSGQY